jgi:hypothetical protein
LGWYREEFSVLLSETVSLLWAGRLMATTVAFATPARILIPKLVRSRDAWKAKANQRKVQRKSLEIRVRDLANSRDLHRQRADLLQQRVAQLEAEAIARPATPPPDSTAPQKK